MVRLMSSADTPGFTCHLVTRDAAQCQRTHHRRKIPKFTERQQEQKPGATLPRKGKH